MIIKGANVKIFQQIRGRKGNESVFGSKPAEFSYLLHLN